MELSDEMCKNLIKWLQTLELSTTAKTLEELSDGVLMAQALVQIAPDYFIRLNSSIHTDIGTNWRLKVNNLRKIIKCLEEYYQDVLNLHLLDTAKPDLSKIGEHSDHKEIGKMLRLILGCAVNCDAKQEYITRIMALEESVQQNIMQAIQQLEEVTHGRGRSSLSLLGMESDTKFQRLLAELEAATEVKDLLSQKCHNLETQIVCLTEEKSNLSVENGRLLKKIKEVESYSRDEPEGTMRNTEMRRQIESLKDDLFKIETQRDDYRLKVLEQEKEMQQVQDKNLELQSAAEKAAQLKDEIDALTETADKAKTLEMTVASYKKKLEEYADLKRKYKTLKDENNEYYQQNIKYQEEIKRNNLYKSQSELYKKQVVDLHQKIEEESRKCDKLSFENKKLQSKLVMVQREKESLIEERDGLKEMNEELHCQQQRQKSEEPTAVASELAPTELQARVKYLERENASLRSSSEEAVAKQLIFEDVQNRLEKALEQNRNYNHRILELEAQVEEVTKGISGCSSGSSAEQQQQQAMDELAIYRNKCSSLQNSLANKENELQTTVARYKKSLEKARDVIKQLEPDVSSMSDKSVKPQQQRSTEEDQFMSKRLAAMREQEEKLLTSSFYKLTMVCQREAVDERFALLTHGQSFLSRQRQSASRKTIQPFRSK